MIKFEEYGTNEEGRTIYAKIDEDGLIRYTCFENDPAYQAWLNPTENGTISQKYELETIESSCTNKRAARRQLPGAQP